MGNKKTLYNTFHAVLMLENQHNFFFLHSVHFLCKNLTGDHLFLCDELKIWSNYQDM